MNYLMVDISGKVPNYDIALCEAMHDVFDKDDHITLLAANINPLKIKCPSKKLFSIIPKPLQNSENKIKRAFKALEGILNYIYLFFYVFFYKNDVIHFQWLPFLEVSLIEVFVLKLIKVATPKSKFILTVHNIYPHNFGDSRKISYRNRFAKVEGFFDKFIVHLQVSKKEFCKEFGIDGNRVEVIHHGVFEPKGLKIKPHKRGEKLNLIMYGNQSYYKGTDILVDAIALLSKEVQAKVHTLIVGKIDPNYYAKLKEKSKDLDIEWIPHFVPDDVLYEKIQDSDVIVLPYRQISQSGVLLLALNFNRMIITSDLPSFKETLSNEFSNFFFKREDAFSLKYVIENVENNQIDEKDVIGKIESVKYCNSWMTAACKYCDKIGII